jgi:CheY-like chemotaxis protein
MAFLDCDMLASAVREAFDLSKIPTYYMARSQPGKRLSRPTLTKPVHIRDLAAALGSLISGSAAPVRRCIDSQSDSASSSEARVALVPLTLGAKGRVLVVEDFDIVRRLMQTCLDGLGYAVDVAENGKEGVKKFKRNALAYSAVLMDCEMPVMDGFKATRKIREFEKAQDLPAIAIVALTGNALLANKEKCLEAG